MQAFLVLLLTKFLLNHAKRYCSQCALHHTMRTGDDDAADGSKIVEIEVEVGKKKNCNQPWYFAQIESDSFQWLIKFMKESVINMAKVKTMAEVTQKMIFPIF